jgi:type IV pilus assembly protein PilF
VNAFPQMRARSNGFLALAAIFLLAIMALSGCAGLPGKTGSASPDLATDSDESPVRKRARLRLELAVNYFEQGQTRVALDEVKQALTQDPAYAEAHNLRGLIYLRLGDYRLSEEGFKQSLALNPRDGNTLHNYGWLMCQQGRFSEAGQSFGQALANPIYGDRAKTLMAQGLCESRAGNNADAERSLSRSYELEPGNPVTGFNLSNLLLIRGDLLRSQFYIRRINNSELANAESLWLGIKVERKLDNREAMKQLAEQLGKRFAQSREMQAYQRGAFDE